MAIKDAESWFRVIDINTATDLSISCPNCDYPHTVGPLFDEEFRECVNCKTRLVEWNLIRFVYLIAVDKSPAIIQNLALYIRSISAMEGWTQLEILHNFLGVELFSEL